MSTDFAGRRERAFAVDIQGDGRIVAAGYGGPTDTSGHDFALARYNSDGSLDSTFSGDGKVTTDVAGEGDRAGAVAIQGDGKIVAVGSAITTSTFGDFALARYSVCRRASRGTSIPCR